jgi:hypothetical protein
VFEWMRRIKCTHGLRFGYVGFRVFHYLAKQRWYNLFKPNLPFSKMDFFEIINGIDLNPDI